MTKSEIAGFEERVEDLVSILEDTEAMQILVWRDRHGEFHFEPRLLDDPDAYPLIREEAARMREMCDALSEYAYGRAILGESYDRWIQRKGDA